MSEVRIDETALAAEADAIAADAPQDMSIPQPELAAGPNPAELEQGYKMIAFAVMDRTAAIAAPNWNITPQEKDKVSTAVAQALVLWFPDQPIPPKYLALLIVAGCVFEVVEARRDPQTGKLKPRHVKPAKQETAAAAP